MLILLKMVGVDVVSQEKNWNGRSKRSRMESRVIPHFKGKEEKEKATEMGSEWEVSWNRRLKQTRRDTKNSGISGPKELNIHGAAINLTPGFGTHQVTNHLTKSNPD